MKRIGARPVYEHVPELPACGRFRFDVPAEFVGRPIEIAFGGPSVYVTNVETRSGRAKAQIVQRWSCTCGVKTPTTWRPRAIVTLEADAHYATHAYTEGAPYKRTRNVAADREPTYFRLVGAAADGEKSYDGWKTATDKLKATRKRKT